MIIPTFDEWFRAAHGGKSFNELHGGHLQPHDDYLREFTLAMQQYTQVQLQRLADALMG